MEMQTPFPVLRQTLFDAGEGRRNVVDSLITWTGHLCVQNLHYTLEHVCTLGVYTLQR